MTTSLAERYIAATISELPEDLRDEVRPELEGSIADALEARLLRGEDRATAEREVLTELGDPAVLAASYADRPLQLIGPKYYLTWWRLLKRLLTIILPLVFVISAFAQVLAGGDIGDIVSQPIVVTLSTAMHIFFWTTLAFAIMERTGAELGTAWSVDDLPEPRQDRPGRGDLVASLVFLGIVFIALAWDQTASFIRVADERIPIFNPELWPWGMAGFIGLVVLEMIFAIVLYLRGGWNVIMAIIKTAISVSIFSWFITLLVRGDLFSAELLTQALENGVDPGTQYTLAVLFGFGVGIVATLDIVESWVKTYRASQ